MPDQFWLTKAQVKRTESIFQRTREIHLVSSAAQRAVTCPRRLRTSSFRLLDQQAAPSDSMLETEGGRKPMMRRAASQKLPNGHPSLTQSAGCCHMGQNEIPYSIQSSSFGSLSIRPINSRHSAAVTADEGSSLLAPRSARRRRPFVLASRRW